MAKMGETGVKNTVWQKWVKVTMAKMGETGVRDTVAKMGGAHCGKMG